MNLGYWFFISFKLFFLDIPRKQVHSFRAKEDR